MRWVISKCTLLSLIFAVTRAGKGGKTASKVGLAGISQAGGSSSSGSQGLDNDHVYHKVLAGNISNIGMNEEKKLKFDLFIRKAYDRKIRPVRNYNEQVLVQVDLSYIQVLNLNEKDQILSSLVRLRIYWRDDFLSWDPKDYNGLKTISLPATAVWFPDIVLYEETGASRYIPRIPYVVVDSDGTVGFSQPTAYETTCVVNIALFPFDKQECKLSFTSWSFPSSKLDLMTKRTDKLLNDEIANYFVGSGEWLLDKISTSKLSTLYADVLDETEEDHDDHEDDHDEEPKYATMNPLSSVRDVNRKRITPIHWSSITYQFNFRRNTSLYLQSLVFPALLLMTISLLGFYLPPDSGERIGLQITILLTFMVFLLTVGDMFSAAAGPYLGVYFVLCMALLGLNIIMTVLVLHLHHMPPDAVMKETEKKGVYRVEFRNIPYWIKLCLFCCGQYMELINYHITEDDIELLNSNKTAIAFVKHLLKKWKDSVVKKRFGQKPTQIDVENSNIGPSQDVNTNNIEQDYMSVGLNGAGLKKSGYQTDGKDHESESDHVLRLLTEELAKKLSLMSKDVLRISNFIRYRNSDIKENRLASAMGDKWKTVARYVDHLCLRVYIGCLCLCHLGILIAILWDVYN